MQDIDNSGTAPNKGPNFLLIVILASIAILLVLTVGYFTVRWDGHKLVPKAFGSHPHPTAETVLPPLPPPSRALQIAG